MCSLGTPFPDPPVLVGVLARFDALNGMSLMTPNNCPVTQWQYVSARCVR